MTVKNKSKKMNPNKFFHLFFFSIYCLIFVFFPKKALADRITSAFKQIQKGEFTKAKQQLNKQLEKDTMLNAGVFHAFAEYYFSEKNPAYNVDSAYFFVQKSIFSYAKTNPKTLKDWAEDKITLENAQKLKEDIEIKSYALAEKSNTLTAYQTFLQHFPKAKQAKEAEGRFYQIAWTQARNDNKLEIYQNFIQNYPNAPQKQEANRLRDSLIFKRETLSNKKSEITQFLTQFPKNFYKNDAIEKLFWLDSWQHTPEFYRDFIRKYPQAPITAFAYAWLRVYATEKNDLKNLLKEFPEFPEKEYVEKFENTYKNAYIPFLDNELFGYVDEKGKITIPASLEEVPKKHLCHAQFLPYFITQKNNRIGLQDAFGKVIVAPQFDQVDFLTTGLLRVNKNAEQGIFHLSGREILPIKYDLIEVLNDKFLKIRKNRRWGIATHNGIILIEPKYTEIETLNKSFIVLTANGESQITNNDWLGLWLAEKTSFPAFNHWQKLETEENIIKLNVDADNPVSKLIGANGSVLFSDFENILYLPTQIFALQKNKNWFLYDKISTPISANSYQALFATTQFVGVKINNKWGILDKTGKIHHEATLDSMSLVGNALIYWKNKKMFAQFPQKIVDITGLRNLTAEKGDYNTPQFYIKYEDALRKKGLFSPEGNKILPATAQNYYIVSPKEIVFQQNGKYGLLDSLGKFSLMPKYDGITKADEGEYVLTNQRKFGFWAKGFCLIEPNFDEPLQYFKANKRPLWFVAKRNNLFGVVDSKGATLIPLEYTELIAWKDSIALVLDKKGKWNFVHFNKKSQEKLAKMDFEKVKIITKNEEDTFVQIELNGLLGAYSAKYGNIIPFDFEHINNIGTKEHPIFFAEHKSKDKKRYQVIYFSQTGKEMWSNVLKEDEYLRIVCE